jgi:nitroreductase
MMRAVKIDLGLEQMTADAIGANPSLKNPPTSLPADFINRIARAGALAPSGDNLQPWSFSSDGETLLLRHDPQRDLSLFNVQALASLIALGAVLENIQIAASTDGYHTMIEIFPDGENSELIARISFEPGARPDPLAAFLYQRCTNRRPYEKKSIRPEMFAALDYTKQFPTIGLSWVEDRAKLLALGKLVALADRFIFENERIHSHLFSTLRWTPEQVARTRDGMPIESLELGRLGSIAFRGLKNWPVVKFLNHFGFSRAAANHSAILMQRGAAGLIAAPDTSRSSFLQAGRAFQRLWLQATENHLALQPMSAIIFLQLRSRLRDYEGLTDEQMPIVDALNRDLSRFFELPETRVPAMLFRIGFAAGPSGRTIRRETETA